MDKICSVGSNSCQDTGQLPPELNELKVLTAVIVATLIPDNKKFANKVTSRLSRYQLDTTGGRIDGMSRIVALSLFMKDATQGNRNGIWRDDFFGDEFDKKFAVNQAADYVIYDVLRAGIIVNFPWIFETANTKDVELAAIADTLLKHAASVLFPNERQETDVKDLANLAPLKDINQQAVDFAGMAGKPTVVLHWATWCPACMESMPFLSELISDKMNIVLITDDNSDREEVRDLAERFPTAVFVQGTDEALQDVRQGLRRAIPTFVVYDAAGKPANIFLGGGSEAISNIKAFLDELIKGEGATPRIPKGTHEA